MLFSEYWSMAKTWVTASRIGRSWPRVRDAWGIARDLCSGLNVASDKGVLHRDRNRNVIWATGRVHVLIMDFGIAALAAQIHTLK